MKIAYFIGTLKKVDGVTRVILELSKVMASRGHQVVIITGYAEDKSISSVPVIEVPSIIFPLNREYRLSLPGSSGFAKFLDNFQPDVIHLHSPDTIAWAALHYGQRKGIPVLATHHSDFSRYLPYYHLQFAKKFLWHLLRRLYGQAALVTVPSRAVEDDLRSHGINNVKVLPWGMDPEIFNPSSRSEAWRKKIAPAGEKIVLYVGRLVWEKDLATLAEADKILRQKRKDYQIVISGGGLILKDLQRLIPEAVFLPPLDRIDLAEAYASSDIFFFPSSTETFGLVTLEAMASGIAPVVAAAGGSLSLVEEGITGFLAEPKNAQIFAQKIEKLLDDPALLEKIRQNAHDFSLDFSWEKVVDKLFTLYNDILK
jgi:phosphatidylinositol alpha 1,6-mannosyltransferase